MKQIQTHYDKLKVARDAPNEVIRAAYKSLSQKYHPDRNQGNGEAARIMSEINVAYDVLSDAESRKLYDMELRQQELANQPVQQNETKSTHEYTQNPYQRESREYDQRYQEQSREYEQRPPIESIVTGLFGALLRNRIFFVILLLCLWSWFGSKSSLLPTPLVPKTQEGAAPSSMPAAYVRPATAPNGHPWPEEAGYISGYEQSRADGFSTVTVDNSQNDSDVFVNLMYIKIGRSRVVRYFYIPAHSKFTVTKVATGIYGIRYQDLTSGEFSSSKPFLLQETTTDAGVKNSNVTITIYKVSRESRDIL